MASWHSNMGKAMAILWRMPHMWHCQLACMPCHCNWVCTANSTVLPEHATESLKLWPMVEKSCMVQNYWLKGFQLAQQQAALTKLQHCFKHPSKSTIDLGGWVARAADFLEAGSFHVLINAVFSTAVKKNAASSTAVKNEKHSIANAAAIGKQASKQRLVYMQVDQQHERQLHAACVQSMASTASCSSRLSCCHHARTDSVITTCGMYRKIFGPHSRQWHVMPWPTAVPTHTGRLRHV